MSAKSIRGYINALQRELRTHRGEPARVAGCEAALTEYRNLLAKAVAREKQGK